MEAKTESNDVRLKQLRIKTGILKRLHKELQSYEREANDEQTRLDEMKLENRQESDITHQELILKETLNVLPDIKQRFETAYNDLKSLVLESEDICDNELYKGARDLLDTIRI